MNKKVSLKDIAREVGVSTALVSYVLNNLKQGRISKEVAHRIKEVASRLNYRPNQLARSLKTNKTLTIGLIVADISNPFSSSLARIVEDEANKLNYTVIFGSSDENPEKSTRLVDTFLDRQVDGLIISPPAGGRKQVEDLLKQEIPLVLLDRYFPGLDTSYVMLDNFGAASAGTRHLLDSGCRRIGFIGYSSGLVHLNQREEGFRQAHRERGLDIEPALIKKVEILNNQSQIEKSLDEILNEIPRPDGLMFASNIIAAHCLKKLNHLPLKVPDDLSIVCFDETASLNLFYGPLTYIRQPLQAMGEAATRILVDQINGNNASQHVVMEGEVLAGN